MRKIDLIIIHCSATRADSDFSAQDVDTAHRYRGFSSWGYHYYIRKSGQVELMRSEEDRLQARLLRLRLYCRLAVK